jgi:hypothetical protein
MTRTRLALGTAGVLLGSFGVYRLWTQEPHAKIVELLKWLAGALVIHDGIIAPAVVAVGWVIARVVPPRARRYVQAGLIVGALITVVAIPLIYRRDTQPVSKAILLRNYGGNLALLLGLVAGACVLAYAARVARDHSRISTDRAAPDPTDGPNAPPA